MLAKLLKSLFVLVALLTVVVTVAVLALALMAIEGAPAVQQQRAPTSDDVIMARSLPREIKAAAGAEPGQPNALSISEPQLSGLLRLGARLFPGFRSEVAVGPDLVAMQASVPLPLPGATRWLNLSVTVPEFETRLTLERVALGRLVIPPGVALELARIGTNLIFGGGLGDKVITAASGMRVSGDAVTVDLQIAAIGDNEVQRRLLGETGLRRGVFKVLRGSTMPPLDRIDAYDIRIREAMDRGDLPDRGSFLPYLVFTLEAAHEGARTEGASDAFTAAIFAMARICGAQDFPLMVGDMGRSVPGATQDWETDCRRPTLKSRIDSRRHFITAAALKAASNRNVSVAVGEYKELYDIVKSGGFDFTDLAANHAGIRLANLFLSTPVEDWSRLIARIRSEADVIMTFDGIPQILTEAEFAAQFGSVDSRRYDAMLDHIENRIDALPLHAP